MDYLEVILGIIFGVLVFRWAKKYWNSLDWYKYEYRMEVDSNPSSATWVNEPAQYRMYRSRVRRPIIKVLLKRR